MGEAVLYVLTGTTLYAGAHHLYLGTTRTSTQPHLQLAAMYLLLAGFVLASALTVQSQEISAQVQLARLSMTLGILLWVALIWYIAFYTRSKPLLLLDLLTAVWVIFLIRNMSSPHGLLYAGIAAIDGTLLSGQNLSASSSAVSSWWTAVMFTVLASLLFCFYASLWMFRRGNKQAALALFSGLFILAAASLTDHLLTTPVTLAWVITPLGFFGFLLANSLYPILLHYRNRRNRRQAPMIYNLTFNPERTWFDTQLADLQSPAGAEAEAAAAQPSEPASNPEVAPFSTFLPDDNVNHRQARQGESPSGERGCPGAQGESPSGERGSPGGEGSLRGEAVDVAVIEPETKADGKDSGRETGKETPWQERAMPTLKPGHSRLNAVSDNLMDIAVYATIALNRFQRGDTDPQALAMLCKKIRTKAIKTRRMANKLSRPGKPGNDIL